MRRSFLFAFKGVALCVRTERNFRIHLAVTFYVLIASLVTRLSAVEWSLILLCAGAVLGAELFNTAAERLCDALHPDRSPAIGTVKDLAAGAVLVFAVMSAAVGGIIFFNDDKIPRIAAFAKGHIALSILIAATLPLAVYLVFRRYKNDNKVSYDNDRRAAERR
jgi:diacylglycerol kinase